MEKYANVNGINIHYFDYPSDGPVLMMLPGLTANATYFEGVIQAGLRATYRLITMDMRGRGLSDKPETGYSMRDHAEDIIALMDHLGIDQFVLFGHSFGGLLGYYMAAKYPDRIPKAIIVDASILLITERTRQMIKASLDRLKAKVPSMEVYVGAMKKLAYLDGYWDEALEKYYRNDVRINEDGTVQALASAAAVDETIDQEFIEPWDDHIAAIKQPVLLLNAQGAFGPAGAPALMPKDMAEETIASLADCTYVEIPGNHITMFFGDNARHIVDAVGAFVQTEGIN